MIGDCTYFDDRRFGSDKFEETNVLYNYDFSKNRLVIGNFYSILRKKLTDIFLIN
jgi:virginiamycin A acetyltransferase